MSYDGSNQQSYPPGQYPGMQVAAPTGAAGPDDLTLPLYGARFGQSVKRFFKNYTKFNGRASRSEYWWAALFLALLQLVPTVLTSIGALMATAGAATAAASIDPNTGALNASPGPAIGGVALVLLLIGSIVGGIIWLATIIPTLAVSWRRLHDGNFAGPFFFLHFIPSIGSIVVLVLMCMPPKAEGQRFDA